MNKQAAQSQIIRLRESGSAMSVRAVEVPVDEANWCEGVFMVQLLTWDSQRVNLRNVLSVDKWLRGEPVRQ